MNVSGVKGYSSVPFGNSEIEEKELENLDLNQDNPQKSSTKKVVLTLSALAAASLAGIMLLKHGKGKLPEISGEKQVGEIVEDAGMKMTEEARKIYDDVNNRLHQPSVNADLLDEMYLPKNEELERLNRYFAELEEGSNEVIEKGQKLKAQIEEVTLKTDEHLDETIDNILGRKQMLSDVRTEMTEFYTKMEDEAAEKARILAEKQAKRDAMLKLKEENPAEYARLKSERAKAKKAEKAAAKAEKLVVETSTFNGQSVKVVSEKTKDRTIIERAYSLEDNKLLLEYQEGKGFRLRTTYTENGKFSTKRTRNLTTEKFYVKNENGEYILAQKQVVDRANDMTKTVTRLEDGKTNITVEDRHKKGITIRDKKGNVISEETFVKRGGKTPPSAEPPKMLAEWYVNYLELCKKCGESPRICGIPGGAWDHFRELNMKVYDPEAYEAYIRLRTYRARYDERAAILQALDNNKITLEGIEDLKPEEQVKEVERRFLTMQEQEKQALQAAEQRQRQRQRVMVYA